MKRRLNLWLMVCVYVYLSSCVSSHSISTRFLIQCGKITSKQSVDDDSSQLFFSNQDHKSVVSLNDKIYRSHFNNYSHLKKKTEGSKSLGMSDLLVVMNLATFFFSSRDPNILRKFEKNDYRLVCGEAYRLMTSIFLHADLPHITGNNISLSEVGPEVEKMFGRIMFLLIYLLSGILANLGTFAFANAPVSLGASGAICGLYGAYTYYYLANRKRLGSLTQYVLTGVKNTILWNVVMACLQTESNIDHYAHAYGFIAGIGIATIIFAVRDLKKFFRSLRVSNKKP